MCLNLKDSRINMKYDELRQIAAAQLGSPFSQMNNTQIYVITEKRIEK